MNKQNKEVKYYLDNFVKPDENKLFKDCEKRISLAFFPTRGYDFKLSEGRKAISDFRKMSDSKILLAGLMLHYTEMGVALTNEYGDISEPFYTSIAGMYQKALELMHKEGLLGKFGARAKKILNDTADIGWGFHDDLADSYYSFF